MSVLKYFKNIPRSPPHRATGSKCNFFSSNLQRCPWKKKEACRPPTGDRGPVAPSPPTGDRGNPVYKLQSPFPPHLSPKIPPKIQKKREG